MAYSKELPKNFKTWVEFYDEVRRLGLRDDFMEVHVTEPSDVEPEINDSPCLVRAEMPKYKTYLIRDIKDNALEEVLAERMSKKEIIYFTQEVKQNLRDLKYKEGHPLFATLSRVKRILLTIEGVKDGKEEVS